MGKLHCIGVDARLSMIETTATEKEMEEGQKVSESVYIFAIEREAMEFIIEKKMERLQSLARRIQDNDIRHGCK
jgi:hypothetical protein